MHWIYHWFWIDFWTPVWPNIVASVVVWAFMWWKFRAMKELHHEMARLQIRHHHEQMQAIKTETEIG